MYLASVQYVCSTTRKHINIKNICRAQVYCLHSLRYVGTHLSTCFASKELLYFSCFRSYRRLKQTKLDLFIFVPFLVLYTHAVLLLLLKVLVLLVHEEAPITNMTDGLRFGQTLGMKKARMWPLGRGGREGTITFSSFTSSCSLSFDADPSSS